MSRYTYVFIHYALKDDPCPNVFITTTSSAVTTEGIHEHLNTCDVIMA